MTRCCLVPPRYWNPRVAPLGHLIVTDRNSVVILGTICAGAPPALGSPNSRRSSALRRGGRRYRLREAGRRVACARRLIGPAIELLAQRAVVLAGAGMIGADREHAVVACQRLRQSSKLLQH